jgi:hypothetical protein
LSNRRSTSSVNRYRQNLVRSSSTPVFAALAEFIRELIIEGTREGLDAARARGQRLGRPPAMTPEQIKHARDLLAQPHNTVSSIARVLGISRSTIYKYVPELAEGRPALTAGNAPNALPGPRENNDYATYRGFV